MYSNAAFFLTGSHYRFMNPVTIHPLASKLRQKSRMYIYNFIGISMQKQVRHANKETGKLADFVVTNADYTQKRVFISGKEI